jgi:hypothetical protein
VTVVKPDIILIENEPNEETVHLIEDIDCSPVKPIALNTSRTNSENNLNQNNNPTGASLINRNETNQRNNSESNLNPSTTASTLSAINRNSLWLNQNIRPFSTKPAERVNSADHLNKLPPLVQKPPPSPQPPQSLAQQPEQHDSLMPQQQQTQLSLLQKSQPSLLPKTEQQQQAFVQQQTQHSLLQKPQPASVLQKPLPPLQPLIRSDTSSINLFRPITPIDQKLLSAEEMPRKKKLSLASLSRSNSSEKTASFLLASGPMALNHSTNSTTSSAGNLFSSHNFQNHLPPQTHNNNTTLSSSNLFASGPTETKAPSTLISDLRGLSRKRSMEFYSDVDRSLHSLKNSANTLSNSTGTLKKSNGSNSDPDLFNTNNSANNNSSNMRLFSSHSSINSTVRTAVAEPKQIAISGQVEGVNQQTVG